MPSGAHDVRIAGLRRTTHGDTRHTALKSTKYAPADAKPKDELDDVQYPKQTEKEGGNVEDMTAVVVTRQGDGIHGYCEGVLQQWQNRGAERKPGGGKALHSPKALDGTSYAEDAEKYAKEDVVETLGACCYLLNRRINKKKRICFFKL